MKKISVLLLFMLAVLPFIVTQVDAAAIYDHQVTYDMNGGDFIYNDISDLGAKLTNAELPQTMLLLGDSTSDATDEWYYLLADQFAPSVPDYSVVYKKYDVTTSSYKDTVIIQEGSLGDAYASFDGTNGDYMTAMDSNELSVTGDIEINAKVKLTAGKGGTVVAKYFDTTSGNNSYFLSMNLAADGVSASASFYWTEDGTTNKSANSGVFVIDSTKPVWLNFEFDVDNGALGYTPTFNFSQDGVTYTLISATATAAGTTSIYDSTAEVEIGSRYNGTTTATMDIYDVEIRDGIGGQVVADVDMDQAFPSTISSFSDVEGNTWVVSGNLSVGNGSPGLLFLNGSISGALINTFNATLLDSLINVDIDFLMINLGHNEDLNDTYASKLENFIDSVKLYTDEVPVMLITQNAQTSPRTADQIAAQNIRMDQVELVAARNNYVFCDAGAALDTDPTTYVSSSDGIHPTTVGSIVWADQVYDLLNTGITGNGVSQVTLLYEDGELLVYPDSPTRTGETFIGWFTDENLTNEWDITTDLVQGDMTLYAKYSDSAVGTAGLLSAPSDPVTLLGLAWYWYIPIVIAVYYFGFTNEGRKRIGLKKRR